MAEIRNDIALTFPTLRNLCKGVQNEKVYSCQSLARKSKRKSVR